MTFSRLRSNTFFDYNINGIALLRKTDVIKDLGVLFEPKLIFNAHIRYIKDKALKLLGFIFRSCVDFKDKNTFISVYCSLVRSILEYGSIICSPHNIGLITTLEKVQNKFLHFLAFKCNLPRTPHTSPNINLTSNCLFKS